MEPTVQKQAFDLIVALFDDPDPATTSVIDQIVAALDGADLLIKPAENALWQNLQAGHMSCHYTDGELRFSITEAGKEHIQSLGVEPS